MALQPTSLGGNDSPPLVSLQNGPAQTPAVPVTSPTIAPVVSPKTTTPPSTTTTPTKTVTTPTTPAVTTPSAPVTAPVVPTTPTTTPVVPTPPAGIDASTPTGQAEWYNQDPNGFENYATATGMSLTDIYNVEATAGNQKLDNLKQQGIDALNMYLNGTYPLTATQQAQVESTQQMWQSVIDAQGLANQSYLNAAGMTAMRTGGEYNPSGFAQSGQRAIQEGIDKIAGFQGQEQDAVAKMEQAFQDQDYKAVTDALAAQTTIEDKITTNINATYTALQKAQQDAIANKAASDKLALDTIVADDTKSYQDKMAAIAQQNADTTAKKDAADAIIAQETAMKGTYQLKVNPDGSESIFDTRTGAVIGAPTGNIQGGTYTGTDANGNSITPGHTGDSELDSNTSVTASGIPFIDGTNITTKNQSAAGLRAAKLGIPFLTKTSAQSVNLVSKASAVLHDIQANAVTILPTDAQGRIQGAPNRYISGILQTNDQIASFNAWRSGAISAIQGLGAGGTSLRITTPEINLAIANDIPTINDDIGTANGKLAKMYSMLGDAEAPLFGGVDKYDWMKSENSPDPLKMYGASSSAHGAAVVKALSLTDPATGKPYTDSQIMAVLPGDISNYAFSK